MTEDTKQSLIEEAIAAPKPDMTQVSITLEQICAAIISHNEKVEIPTAALLTDYSGKTIQITHDEETNIISFELADAPKQEEVDGEATASE